MALDTVCMTRKGRKHWCAMYDANMTVTCRKQADGRGWAWARELSDNGHNIMGGWEFGVSGGGGCYPDHTHDTEQRPKPKSTPHKIGTI